MFIVDISYNIRVFFRLQIEQPGRQRKWNILLNMSEMDIVLKINTIAPEVSKEELFITWKYCGLIVYQCVQLSFSLTEEKQKEAFSFCFLDHIKAQCLF